MNKFDLAQYLDSTNLKNDATIDDITQLCLDAVNYQFKSVCIHPYYLSLAKKLLTNTNVLVCTVIGFPLGMNTLVSKMAETKNAIDLGADEIDMVINIANLKQNSIDLCIDEINCIKNICGNRTLKVIVETSLLNDAQKITAAKIVLKSNADFIKTSTGFVGSGAQLDDIKLWKSFLSSQTMIKASGGIRDLKTCLEFINAGANRIGTSNATTIIKEFISIDK